MFDNEFDDMLAVEYESFLIDDEPEYDVFKSDDLCYAVDCLLTDTSESVSSSPTLKLKLLPDSLKYSFLGPDEPLPVIIPSDLDQDQETN